MITGYVRMTPSNCLACTRTQVLQMLC